MRRLSLILDERFLRHRPPQGHPERPERLSALQTLQDNPRFGRLEFTEASVDDLARVHSQALIQKVEKTRGCGVAAFDGDTYASADSYETALLASGAAMRAVQGVIERECTSAFALLRPPGHHAESGRAMGFCLFNHAAVAARYAIDVLGLSRVMIIDWDVHHGNGTQEIFWDTPDVLYCSTHQFPFYPGTGGFEERGMGEGLGYTVNIPMPAGCGDAEFAKIFSEIVVPVGEQYQPDLVLVSAGYDAHHADPLGGQNLTRNGFSILASAVSGLADRTCNGRLAFVLEGGYDLAGLREGVEATVEIAAGISSPHPLVQSAHPEVDGLLARVKRMHGEIWKF